MPVRFNLVTLAPSHHAPVVTYYMVLSLRNMGR